MTGRKVKLALGWFLFLFPIAAGLYGIYIEQPIVAAIMLGVASMFIGIAILNSEF